MHTPLFLKRLPFAALLAASLLGSLSGCGGGGKSGKNSISGKVTMNDQPVAGQIIFIGADKKEFSSPLGPEGNYLIMDVPKGEYQILVKPPLQAIAPPKGAGGGGLLNSSGNKGSNPPAKYATVAGGLKVTVTGGEQTHDIPLTP